MKTLNPEGWHGPAAFQRRGRQRRLRFVSGMIGWDSGGTIADGFAAQFAQTLDNTIEVLAAGGARPEHIVRMTWYVTDLDAYRASLRELGPIYRERIGRHFPSMAVIGVSGLVEEDALLEIETTAVIPPPTSAPA